jgi:hypothetical protein
MEDIDLTSWPASDLLYAMQQQFPLSPSPCEESPLGYCPLCGQFAWGGRACANCLSDEMERRDMPAFDFMCACKDRRRSQLAIDGIIANAPR